MTLEMRFEEPPDLNVLPVDLFAIARVEERDSADVLVQRLSESAPALFFDATARTMQPLALDVVVPHGAGRVIWVELREGSASDAQAIFVGRSEPFSLKAGETKTVQAALRLTELFNVLPGRRGLEMEIIGETEGRVPSPKIQLRFRVPETARSIRVSNLAGFPEGDATETFVVERGGRAITLEWDLDRGLNRPCGVTDFCQRQVNSTVVDVNGYSGRPIDRQVAVDTMAPSADPETLDIRLVAPTGSLVSSISRLGVGSEYRVSMGFSEPVRAAPVVRARPSGDSAVNEAFELRALSSTTAPGGLGTAFSWSLVVPEDPPEEGDYVLEVVAVDRVGNEGHTVFDASASKLSIDTESPTPPDAERMVYLRAPWGDGSDSDPRFEVLSERGAAEPGSSVLFFTSPDVLGQTPLARTEVGADGRFPDVDLGLTEQDLVFALAVDPAGNPSDAHPEREGIQATAVERGQWVATLANKIRGLPAPNPHEVLTAGTALPQRILPSTLGLEPETASIELLALGDGRSLSVGGRYRWRRVEPVRWPPRGSHQMGFMPKTGRAVLFGGLDGFDQGLLRDQWLWERLRWSEAPFSLALPPPRWNATMAFFPPRGELIMFGGCVGLACAGTLNELWAWDGEAWRERSELTGRPRPRVGHSMVYDSARSRLLVFGGSLGSGQGDLPDLWSFDGDAWTRLEPGGVPISARSGVAIAYDEARDEVVLAGSGGLGDGTTYVFDGADWSIAATSENGPADRAFHAMVYDPVRRKVVLYGGATDEGLLRETWEWDGATRRWTRMPGSPSGPRPRYDVSLFFDTTLGQVVMAGGCARGVISPFGISCEEGLADTWAWDGAAWRPYARGGFSPSPVGGYAMAFDATSNRSVVFGGCLVIDTQTGVSCARETRLTAAFDGAGWSPVAFSGPSSRVFAGMASQPVRGGVVLFGGATTASGFAVFNDTWTFQNGNWSFAGNSGPSARGATAMTEDPTSGRVLLFGGTNFVHFPPLVNGMFSDLWAWNGSSWSRIVPTTAAQPEGRAYPAMAVDPDRRKLVLFGGFGRITGFLPRDPFPDLWEFDLSSRSWTRVTLPGSTMQPQRRGAANMFWDPSIGEVVLVGGSAAEVASFDDAWSWNGTRWARLDFAGEQPDGMVFGRVLYDPSRREVVRYGGLTSAGLEGETWVTRLDRPGRPEVRVRFDLDDANLTKAEVESWTLEATAGASAGAERGFEIDAWDASLGRYIVEGADAAGVDAPRSISVGRLDATARLSLTGDGQLEARIRSRAVGAEPGSPAELVVDQALLRVNYRRPTPACGNGRLEIFAGESCDDGNSEGGDRCSSRCDLSQLTHEKGVNEGATSAQEGGVLFSDWIVLAGDIFPADDRDYWAITLPTEGRVEAQVLFDLDQPDALCGPRHDARMSLRNGDDQELVQNDDFGGSLCPRFTTGRLAPGRYYLVIRHTNDGAPVEPYYIRVRLRGP